MGKKLVIPGADFSENCIIIPLTIVVKAGGSVTIGGTVYNAPNDSDKEFEIDNIPSNFYLNYEDDIKYLRIGSPATLPDISGAFRDNSNIEEVIFAADVYTSTGVGNVLFANCLKLKKLDGTHLFFGADNASMLFYNCSAIEEVKLPHLGEKNNISMCFKNCTNLRSVEFGSDFGLISDAPVSEMFTNCSALETIIAPSLVASEYATPGTLTNKFIQGIDATTGDVTIYCGTGTLTWNGSSWTVS
jgi:hypothetical protein